MLQLEITWLLFTANGVDHIRDVVPGNQLSRYRKTRTKIKFGGVIIIKQLLQTCQLTENCHKGACSDIKPESSAKQHSLQQGSKVRVRQIRTAKQMRVMHSTMQAQCHKNHGNRWLCRLLTGVVGACLLNVAANVEQYM